MILSYADNLLRAGPSLTDEPPSTSRLLQLGGLIVLFGMTYGALMGTFTGVFGRQWLQILYSAVKVPLLLGGTFIIALPSFFVINTLFGLREDFAAALKALAATQAGLTLILASLAPFTVLWYASCSDYHAAILFNAAMFGIASVSSQWLLRRLYRPLILKRPRHRSLLLVWLGIYAFVGIQMAWVLRPFIGNPGQPTHFFRQQAWGNAYVRLASMIWRVLGG